MRSFPRRLIKHSSWRGEHPRQHVVLLVVPLVLVLLFVLHLFLIFIVTAKNCWDSLIPFRIFSTHFVSFMGSKIWSWGEGGAWSTPGRGCCAYGDGLTIDDWRSSRGRWIIWWQRVRFIQVHNLLHLGICLAFHGKDRKDCKENDFGWEVEGWSVGCNSMFVTFRRAHTLFEGHTHSCEKGNWMR